MTHVITFKDNREVSVDDAKAATVSEFWKKYLAGQSQDVALSMGGALRKLSDVKSIERERERSGPAPMTDAEFRDVEEQIASFLRRVDLSPSAIDRLNQFYGHVGAARVWGELDGAGKAHTKIAVRPTEYARWNRLLEQYRERGGRMAIWSKPTPARPAAAL